ncbi:MAG TPA: outer membrane beta-barrel protein [Allosphingosinicella sp.]|jgi:outer membrane immunogenic protein
MRKFILAAAAATVFAAPAYAQDTAGTTGGGHIEVIGGFDYVQGGVEESDSDGILYGVAAGYDFGGGNMVFGIELEATDSTAKECDFGECLRAGRDLYAGGRIGTRMGEDALVYVKAGYTNARVKADDDGVNLDGVRAGLGVQYDIGTNLLAKLEYRYSNYEAGVERHQVVAGVGFRF